MSGGCVEGAVYELCTEVAETGAPVLQRYGVSDDDAFAVGLTCGGIIDVFVEPVSQRPFPELGEVAADIDAGRPVAVATVIEHPDAALARPPDRRPAGLRRRAPSGWPRADDAVTDDARGLLAAGSTTVLTYGAAGRAVDTGMRVFVASFPPQPRMLVFGAIDFAAAVARQGAFLGYHVTVCDARPVFATRARFPQRRRGRRVVAAPLPADADRGGQHRRAHRDLRAHPRPEVRRAAARGRAAAGGPPAGLHRRDGLAAHPRRPAGPAARGGLDDEQLARLSSPIGLDLGARTPEETAVSIAAEIIALRWGGTHGRLSETDRSRVTREPTISSTSA